MTVTLTEGHIAISNYTDAQAVNKIKEIGTTTRIVQVIELTQIIEALDTFSLLTEQDLKANPLYHTLHHERAQTMFTFSTIVEFQKRHTRAINMLGTAWKYLAGTPDNDDLVMLSDNINKLIDNNDQQLTINKQLEVRINRLTKLSNDQANSIKKIHLLETN